MLRTINITLAIAILFVASIASAQEQSITVPPEELKAYEPIRDAQTFDAAIAAARTFFEKYPNSAAKPQIEIDLFNRIVDSPRDASRLEKIAAFKTLFPQSERLADLEFGMLGYYFEQSDYPKIFSAGEAFLTKHPNDVEAHYLLLRAAVDALKSNNTSYVAKGKEHGMRAVELLNQPTRPERFSTDAAWTTFKSESLPLAYQSLGLIGLATGDGALAGEYLQKAVDSNPADPLNFFFLANYRYMEYNALAERFNAMGDRQSDEAKKMLDDANAKVDEVIRLLVKTVAISEADPRFAPIAQQARPMLEESYKQRHDGKLDGLDTMIKAEKGGN